jgi:hypothetical protein
LPECRRNSDDGKVDERAGGTNIISAQFNFAPDELAYVAQNYIHLDQDQTWTAPGGAACTLNQGTKYQTRVSADLLVQSAFQASTPTVPNVASLPEYAIGKHSSKARFPDRARDGIAPRCFELRRRRL